MIGIVIILGENSSSLYCGIRITDFHLEEVVGRDGTTDHVIQVKSGETSRPKSNPLEQ